MSSLCDKFTDGDWIEAKDQSNSGVRLIQTGNVGIAEYIDKPNNKKWVSNSTFETLHCEEVFEGDILISRLPEPAGRACIVPNLGTKMITAVDCTIVRVSDNTSNEFLLQYLSSQKYFDEVNTCLAGGTRQRISRSNLANFDVPIPTKKKEQEAIGSFFAKIDHLITLHQRKCEKLQSIKKSFLQKMFPAQGEDKTKIRFSGFTEPWEQRKFGDIFDYERPDKYIVKSDAYVDGAPTPVLTANKAFVLGFTEEMNTYKNPCIIFDDFTLDSKFVDFDFMVKSSAIKILTVKPNYDLNFSYQRLQNTKIEVLGHARHYISVVQNTDVSCPNFNEQKIIGLLFYRLDNLITLHQRKLSLMEEI